MTNPLEEGDREPRAGSSLDATSFRPIRCRRNSLLQEPIGGSSRHRATLSAAYATKSGGTRRHRPSVPTGLYLHRIRAKLPHHFRLIFQGHLLASPDATALLPVKSERFFVRQCRDGSQRHDIERDLGVLARRPRSLAGKAVAWRSAERGGNRQLGADHRRHAPSLWDLTDATMIAHRLTGMLPGRSTRAPPSPATSKASWLPSLRTAMILVSAACLTAYVISAMIQ